MSSTIKIQSHLSMKTFAPQLTVTSEAMMTKTYKIEFDDKITNAFNFQNFLMEKGSAFDEPVNDYDDETDLSSEDENENNEPINEDTISVNLKYIPLTDTTSKIRLVFSSNMLKRTITDVRLNIADIEIQMSKSFVLKREGVE